MSDSKSLALLAEIASELRLVRLMLQTDKKAAADQVLKLHVTELNCSVRVMNIFKKLGINFLGQLVKWSADELLDNENFGVTSLEEVRNSLEKRGLVLRGDEKYARK